MYLMAVLGSQGIVVKYTAVIFSVRCEFYGNVSWQICKMNIWKTEYGVITQFMLLFQEYTTEKRSTVLSTSSENFNSDFILIVLTNRFIKQVGKSWYEKTTLGYTEKGFRKKAKRTCKGTMPLILKSKMAASFILDFNTPRNLNRIQNMLLSVLEEEVSFIDIHKIISKVKSSVAQAVI